jgi:hypothetical protein
MKIYENLSTYVGFSWFFRLKPTCADPTNVGKARRWLFLLSARHLYTQLFTQLSANKLEAARGLVVSSYKMDKG